VPELQQSVKIMSSGNLAINKKPMLKSRLICHPGTTCPAVSELQVEIELDHNGNLQLRYQLTGDLTCLYIPAPEQPAAIDGLWEHTCFEAFTTLEGEESYHEFNFSPSGQYAGYAFSHYRIRTQWMPTFAPDITCSKSNKIYQLQTMIASTDLPVNMAGKPFQLGLSAVIESHDGSLSYWALHHPSARPDFHCRDGWILSINRSELL